MSDAPEQDGPQAPIPDASRLHEEGLKAAYGPNTSDTCGTAPGSSNVCTQGEGTETQAGAHKETAAATATPQQTSETLAKSATITAPKNTGYLSGLTKISTLSEVTQTASPPVAPPSSVEIAQSAPTSPGALPEASSYAQEVAQAPSPVAPPNSPHSIEIAQSVSPPPLVTPIRSAPYAQEVTPTPAPISATSPNIMRPTEIAQSASPSPPVTPIRSAPYVSVRLST